MGHKSLYSFAPFLLTLACAAQPSGPPPREPEADESSESLPPTETAERVEAEPKPAQVDPEAEKQKRFAQARAELEAEAAKEAQRWTPELEAEAKKLTSTKWKKTKQGLEAALASGYRVPGHIARDPHRHPVETMEFFGLKPGMRVFETSPGGGWWTELLAVVLGANGKLVLASFDSASKDARTAYFARSLELLLGKSKALFGAVETIANPTITSHDMGPPESLDMVLAMRVAHNLVRSDQLQPYLAKAYAALKPGGILAIEQHRAPAGADPKQSATKGYLPEAWLIEQVEAAGFKLEKKSEINANPKDTKDYPEGVWTLPPSLALGDKDRAKYEAIGESDRMTLKFVKPKTSKPKAAKPSGPAAAAAPAKGDKSKAGPKAEAEPAEAEPPEGR